MSSNSSKKPVFLYDVTITAKIQVSAESEFDAKLKAADCIGRRVIKAVGSDDDPNIQIIIEAGN